MSGALPFEISAFTLVEISFQEITSTFRSIPALSFSKSLSNVFHQSAVFCPYWAAITLISVLLPLSSLDSASLPPSSCWVSGSSFVLVSVGVLPHAAREIAAAMLKESARTLFRLFFFIVLLLHEMRCTCQGIAVYLPCFLPETWGLCKFTSVFRTVCK